jgi:AcrR family transcriptional regulator
MGRKSLKPVRQKAIIQAFYKVARKEGLENASIAKVAAVLEVNPSLIIHYFKSKEELLHGLIEYILERYSLIYSPEDGVTNQKKRFEKVIQNLFSRKWNKLIDDGVFYSGYSLIFREKTFKVHYKNIHDRLRKMLADTFRDAQKHNVIQIRDADRAADLVFVFVEGAYFYLSMVSDPVEYKKKLNYYQKTVLKMLKAA